MKKIVSISALVAAAAGLSACTANDATRPSMSFVSPVASTPANGVNYNFNQQPIALTIVNAVRTGTAAVTYNLEVSSSQSFATKAFSRDGITEGTSGTTSVTLTQLDGNTTYYWRWRAVVDGIVGEPSPTQSFFVRPNIVLSAPQPASPGNEDVFSARPTFTTNNAARTGPAGTLFYEFQVSSNDSFSAVVASATVQEQGSGAGGRTSYTPSSDLPEGQLYWRVRAVDPANGIQGTYSSTIQFNRRFGIDLNTVDYMNYPNISQWKETARITSAYHSGDQLCSYYEGGNFPEIPFPFDDSVSVVANQWVFANVGGKWYGGAGHWMKPGQYCKGEVDENFFVDAFTAPPFNTLVLHSGDVFGVLVSTPARNGAATLTTNERTGVQLIVW